MGTLAYIMKKRGVFKAAFSRRDSTKIREIDFEFEALRPYLKLEPNAL